LHRPVGRNTWNLLPHRVPVGLSPQPPLCGHRQNCAHVSSSMLRVCCRGAGHVSCHCGCCSVPYIACAAVVVGSLWVVPATWCGRHMLRPIPTKILSLSLLSLLSLVAALVNATARWACRYTHSCAWLVGWLVGGGGGGGLVLGCWAGIPQP